MKYIIIHSLELESDVLKGLNLSKTRNLTRIGKTEYHVISIESYEVVKELSKFKRFTKEEYIAKRDDILTGISVNRTTPTTSKPSAFKESEGHRVRFKGGFKMTVSAGDYVSQDFLLTDDLMLTGASIKCFNSNFGDSVTLEIVHPTLGVLDTFVDGFYVCDDLISIKEYPAALKAGLSIRLTYNNVGSSQAKLISNLYLHKQ